MADVDRTGRDELHRAALKDDVRKVRERLESGVAADLGDTAGWTPLHFAAQDGSLAAAKVLLDAGANPNTRNNDGQTPLWTAVMNKSSAPDGQMVKLLLAHGGDRHATDAVSGMSPLELARNIYQFPLEWFDEVAGNPRQDRIQPEAPVATAAPGNMRYFDEARELWHTYVPEQGQADTVQGELIRAVEKLRDEAQRNGNINWSGDHEILAEFLRDTLVNSLLFDDVATQEIKADVARILDFEHPETSDDPYDRLADRIVEWSREHPEPVQHRQNPELHI